MSSSHLFRLGQLKPQDQTSGGTRTVVSKANFPILKGMALYKLILFQGGVREPHWHPNADELGYCLKGSLLVTIYGNNNVRESFLVQEGEVFFVPSGFLHHIENVGKGECVSILQFSHEQPEDFGISSALGFLSDAILGNTWGVDQNVFTKLKRSTAPVFAAQRTSSLSIPEEAKYSSLYKYSLGNQQPLVETEGGWAKVARHSVWPILKQQALYLLDISSSMREPHWHPGTAELGYVSGGKGRMSILDPTGKVDTYEMSTDDIYFIPRGYPHYIENLGKEDLKLLIFFDQPMPGDIGFTGSVRAYSDEVLGACMQIDPVFFEQLNKYYGDLFFVKDINLPKRK